MLNGIESYTECGEQVAKARNQRDEARAQFHKRWFTGAKALEVGTDKEAAQKAFDEGYQSARNVPKPLPFR